MKIAFCFAGQGSQTVGMGNDFYNEISLVKEIYDAYPEIKNLCFTDKDNVLNQTAYAQKAILLTGYAIAKALQQQGITPEYCCGLSLGEYTALAFSEAWSLENAIEIITNRGRIMQDALPIGTTKMAAIIGLDREKILATLETVSGVCEIANYNCPGQIVITGEVKAVDEAMVKLTEQGALKAVPLQVSGAFHSSLLKDASKELRNVLEQFPNHSPKYRMVYNITGKEETKPLNDILEEQICHSVYFEDSIRYLLEQGVDCFIEIGPGKALTGFIRRINRGIKVYTVSDLNGFKDTVNKIKEYEN